MILAVGQGNFRLFAAGVRLSNRRWEQHGAVFLPSTTQPDCLALNGKEIGARMRLSDEGNLPASRRVARDSTYLAGRCARSVHRWSYK